ncbi:hypothetical protein PHLCEN_2v2172 [Hermanssonia centrifuga]|uniref:Uncharacterized protein n=1 Tax=Hermanssonia centrifuga TaxID=98765 RepID=A0A2R6RPZ1_9APHY|nr:hypothetical protein PHLCEN_2v2172 [Hermanssonia centrifuga]
MNGNSRTTTQVLFQEHMIPSQSQSGASKRKAAGDKDPLGNAAKKLKRETSTNSGTKRKLLGEEKPGGLVIVRAPSHIPSPDPQANPPQSLLPPRLQPHAPSAQPAVHLTTNGNSTNPPAKKYRADTEPVTSKPATKGKERDDSANTPEVDEDVRQMQSETNSLRQRSRAAEAASSFGTMNPAFQFPPPPTNGHTPITQPSSSRSSRPPHSRGRTVRETSEALPLQETPQIQKNKMMRGDGGHSRRRSSVSRGKRISSSFENTGVIAQPHTSVRDSSFYKHIDVELPEPQRAQQLLIWCAHRAMSELSEANTADSSSKRSGKSPGKDPPLPAEDLQLVKGIGEDLIRMLAEKKIDTNVYSQSEDSDAPRQLKENEQNVRNRLREVKFNAHIQKLKQEDEAWIEVGNSYNSFRGAVLAELEERKKEFPSAKAKGKRRATAEDIALWDVSEKDLPEYFRGKGGLSMARSIVEVDPGRKSPLKERIEDLEFTDLLRAMSRVDAERPQAQVGDAARRAAREVQRAHEAPGGMAERRLTGVPPPTPRKPPGTPRRATTPGKGR